MGNPEPAVVAPNWFRAPARVQCGERMIEDAKTRKLALGHHAIDGAVRAARCASGSGSARPEVRLAAGDELLALPDIEALTVGIADGIGAQPSRLRKGSPRFRRFNGLPNRAG